MIKSLIAIALSCLATTSITTATELSPGDGHGIHLSGVDGVVYYTVEQDGYRVVATLASGTEQLPMRFIATLTSGQRVVFSVPQAAGEPSIDLEIARVGNVLNVGGPVSADTTGALQSAATQVDLQP